MGDRYSDPKPQFGAVAAGIWFNTHEQAQLMQEILSRELKDRAGTQAEPILARWNNELAYIRQTADVEAWRGWSAGDSNA